MSVQEIMSISDPTPIYIKALFNKYLEGKWYEWEPETFRQEIGEPLPDNRWSAIFATAACMNQALEEDTHFVPWVEADIFGDTTQAFAGIAHDFGVLQKPSLGEIWYTLNVFEDIYNIAESIGVGISEQVITYIACCLIDQGFVACPVGDNLNGHMINDKMIELSPSDSNAVELNRKVLEAWNNEEKKQEILDLPSTDAVSTQVLKMEAGKLWCKNRVLKGLRQVRNIGLFTA